MFYSLNRKLKCGNGAEIQWSKYIRQIAMQLAEKQLVALGSVMNECQPATTVNRIFSRHFSKPILSTAKKKEQ